MKIEWLNSERTKARLTRGWFTRRSADVVFLEAASGNYRWYYKDKTRCQYSDAIEDARDKANKDDQWRPVGQVPSARLVSK